MPQQPEVKKTEVKPEEIKAPAAKQAEAEVKAATKQTVEQQIEKAAKDSPVGKEGSIGTLTSFQTQVKAFKFGDVLIPILGLIILVLLSVFVYIPMISQSFEFNNEAKDVASKIVKLDKLNQDLDKMDVSSLQSDLSVSRSVIPFSLQVSDFISQIDDLAKAKNLTFKEIVAGDIQVRSLGDQRNADPVIKGVSGPLKYSGTLSNITNFLDGLKNSSTFLTSTDQIVLRKGSDGTNAWDVSLIVTGYYIDKNNLPGVDLYSPFQSYTQYNSVVTIFKQKVENGKTGTTKTTTTTQTDTTAQ